MPSSVYIANQRLACLTKRQHCLPASLGELARRRHLRHPLLTSNTYVSLCTKLCKYRPTQKYKTSQHHQCHLAKPVKDMSLQDKCRKHKHAQKPGNITYTVEHTQCMNTAYNHIVFKARTMPCLFRDLDLIHLLLSDDITLVSLDRANSFNLLCQVNKV